MKYLAILLLSVTSIFCYAGNYNASKDVIARFTKCEIPLEIRSISKINEKDNYEIKVENGIVKINASSGVAVCRAFYDYTKQNSLGISTWNGSRFHQCDILPEMEQKKVVSPFIHHYYFNVVTYGYTMPYWNWNRWEKEIDWMALHGIDMPLALVASEAILARVWKKLGLTDEEINSYFVAPAHLPWMRMGNLSGVDAPLSEEWHNSQIDLQHKILKRMKSLDMKPICPAFAGFVPEAMKRLYPNINIVKTSWAGSFHNWMLDPKEELFHTIGVQFIKEWEAEFGVNKYYLADSFNEMEIPFPPVGSKERYELLTSYGDKLYRSIRDANKDAVWVMQGWMFGYTRNIWEPATLKALLSKIPNEKMLLLDLAEDYNHHFWHNGNNWDFYDGFFGKQWIYSVIPNMGGKTAMTGYVDFYANGHLSALSSPNKRNLTGHGLAPEGIENNDILYELITDAGWSDQEIDTDKWFSDYAKARYGNVNDSLLYYWKGLKSSVYGSFTDHPRFNWQFRPGRVRKGSVNVNSDFYNAVKYFASNKDLFADSELYNVDLIELAAMYVGGKMEMLIQSVQDALLLDRIDLAKEQFQLFLYLGENLDNILNNHPTHRLNYWKSFAESSSSDSILKNKYVSNAKRLVTIWGPPIDDYSARLWSGLIKDYYLPRWKYWFDAQVEKTTFDFSEWESNWVNTNVENLSEKTMNYLSVEDLIIEADKVNSYKTLLDENSKLLTQWRSNDVIRNENQLSFSLSYNELLNLKGFSLKQYDENEKIKVEKIEISADGKVVYAFKNNGSYDESTLFPVREIKDVTLNNGCEVKFYFKKIKSDSLVGIINAVY